MATVEIRVTVVCADQAERDELHAAMVDAAVGSNFSTFATPSSTTIRLERDDALSIVGGVLEYLPYSSGG